MSFWRGIIENGGMYRRRDSVKIYDISMEIKLDMMVYKNKEEKRPRMHVNSDFSRGNSYESTITMELHTGTHMDAPLHMMPEGDTIDQQDLSQVVTDCRVIDLSDVKDKIRKEHLEKKNIKQGEFILLKTRNSIGQGEGSQDLQFDFNFVYLDKDAAGFLKDKGVIGVGIDSLGIERAQPEHDTHEILMGNKIVIIEGLVLKDVSEGKYTLIALPLKIKGAEASPIRAILIEGEIRKEKKLEI